MRLISKVRTKSALVACILTLAIALPAWSDTLVLRSGATFTGTLVAANANAITFRDDRGNLHRYFVRDVDVVQFGDAPYQSRGGPGEYGPPVDNRPDDRDNRNAQGYGNQDNNNNGNSQAYGNQDNSNNGNRQGYGNQDNSNNGNRQGYGNQDNGGYDQARMERVVLPIGTEIPLRTNERIDSKDVVEGQTFSAQIDDDIRDTDGSIAIPRGSEAKLMTRRLEGNGDITLDVESIFVEGRRYRVSTADQELENHRDGIGANKRTGQFVGGGAILGAIIGGIAGGGRGAAIGAAAGAGAGAGAQIITQGKEVHVPAESVIRFRLDRPLRLHLWS